MDCESALEPQIQSRIPRGWHGTTLGELVTFHRGYDLPLKDMVEGKYPIVGSNGIIGYHNSFKIKGPGVVVGRSGNLGKPFFVEKDYWPHNTSLYVSEFHCSDPYFVYYFLKTLSLAEFNSGSAVPSLNRNHIHKIDVVVPKDIAEQKTIGRILSRLDSRIELNTQMNRVLEVVGEAVFKRWFVDFEFPNEEGKPYKSSGGQMVESKLGLIPLGWEINKLSEIVEIAHETIVPQKFPNSLFQHYSIPAFDQNETPLLTSGHEIKSMKFLVDNESVLVSKLNPETKRIWLPFVNKIDKAICSTEFIIYKPKKGLSRCFIYQIVKTNPFSDFFTSLVTGSTGSRQRVPPKDTLNYELAIPRDKTITNYFCEITDPLSTKQALNVNQKNSLSQIRDLLLPKLMSGRIRVPLIKEIMEI